MNHQWTFPVKAIVGNYDGDTVTVELDLGFYTYMKHSVRLSGVDTPELRGGTSETKALAKEAKKAVANWLEFHGQYGITFHCQKFSGKYGRPIGDFISDVDGFSLRTMLIENRYGVPYDGGSRVEIQEQHKANAIHYGFIAE